MLGAPPDRDAAIVTYATDQARVRGPGLAERLTLLGYSDVRSHEGGIEGWVAVSHPVEDA
jgi:rhodanese-related sulfurtransferase